ncbi:DUF4136 domain-containing protein [Segetibacter sp.]|jgi:hypothetical protein|uniref:DUF4136 domain-containing protein n=1 Tax=Segetibacter sp. TaxID=2231182 RepID=UPI0026298BD9|nr:DUF4136 domain-containing protein [Segetibacter sp.]MCW3079668.1 hypothetical protein [Segetibacter sp.]
MKSKSVLWVTILALGAMFTGCTKDPVANLTAEESRIYITDHDSTVNFSTFRTFSISDSVAVINDGRATKEITATDQAFINAVKAEMQAKGFAMVSKGANPDLGINVSRIYNTSTGIVSYRNYYDMYGGFYDPYYWGYGGYGYYSPYSYATYSIREGALSIDLLNLKNAATSNRINVIWTGLIRGSGIFNSSTAADQVKMLFNQSAYLKNQ